MTAKAILNALAHTIRREGDWLVDDAGNKNSIEYWGSEERAREALESLENCRNCINCSHCSRCSGCSGCSDCSGCRNVAYLYNKDGINANLDLPDGLKNGPPPVPVIENIHAAIYAAASAPGALDMGDWHRCENTHCRGGWAVTLTGDAGKALEQFYDTPLAAMLIYDASDPAFKINPGRLFDKNPEALADMKRLAEGAAS